MPATEWLPQYKVGWLRSDVVAGVTLAAYAIPVSVAYASLAGLPRQAGLYCYLVGGAVYAAFVPPRQLAIGPTSAISILIGSGLVLRYAVSCFSETLKLVLVLARPNW